MSLKCEFTALLEKFEEEIKWLTRIGDLLANGVYESYHWIVLRGVVDKVDLASTPWYWNHGLASNYNNCIKEIEPKLDLVTVVVKGYVYVQMPDMGFACCRRG